MSTMLCAAPSGTALGHGAVANMIYVRTWWRRMGHNRCSCWPLYMAELLQALLGCPIHVSALELLIT